MSLVSGLVDEVMKQVYHGVAAAIRDNVKNVVNHTFTAVYNKPSLLFRAFIGAVAVAAAIDLGLKKFCQYKMTPQEVLAISVLAVAVFVNF